MALETELLRESFAFVVHKEPELTLREVAERHGHHPDLHLTNYRDVEVVLTTHHIGKLSAFDFAVASDLDALDVQYSKKWLKENPLPTAPAPPPAP